MSCPCKAEAEKSAAGTEKNLEPGAMGPKISGNRKNRPSREGL
jgi:hypothetical protein